MSNKINHNHSNKQQAALIGKRIKRARQEIEYSQKELGKALQLSDKTVSAYEVGRAQPSLQTLRDLSSVTHQPISYFLDDNQNQDLDLQIRVKRIEQELLAIKKMLKNGTK